MKQCFGAQVFLLVGIITMSGITNCVHAADNCTDVAHTISVYDKVLCDEIEAVCISGIARSNSLTPNHNVTESLLREYVAYLRHNSSSRNDEDELRTQAYHDLKITDGNSLLISNHQSKDPFIIIDQGCEITYMPDGRISINTSSNLAKTLVFLRSDECKEFRAFMLERAIVRSPRLLLEVGSVLAKHEASLSVIKSKIEVIGSGQDMALCAAQRAEKMILFSIGLIVPPVVFLLLEGVLS